MTTTFTFAEPKTSDASQQAIEAFTHVIQQKPELDKLLGEMIQISGRTLEAAGAGIWVTENPDNPELIIEHNLAQMGLMKSNRTLPGLAIAVRRTAREGKPLIVPPYFVDNEVCRKNPSPYELLLSPIRVGKDHGACRTGDHRRQPPSHAPHCATFDRAGRRKHDRTPASLMEKDRGHAGKLVQFAQQVHGHLHLREVAVDVANLSRGLLEAQRVTVESARASRSAMSMNLSGFRAVIFQACCHCWIMCATATCRYCWSRGQATGQ